MIDILTKDENLFLQQITAIADAAAHELIPDQDLTKHYLNLGNAIEAVHIRSEKIYPEIFKKPSPNYTQIMLRLTLKFGKIRSKINFLTKRTL